MKSKRLIIVGLIVSILLIFSGCGTEKNTETTNDQSITDYYIESLSVNGLSRSQKKEYLSRDDIYAVGNNIAVSKAEVQQYTDFYLNNGESEENAQKLAEKDAMERNALYVAAIQNGYEVTEEDIETEIKRAREKNSRLITVEDRGIEDGDQVTIDFDGSVDGKRFEGGKAEDYPLTIGSHTFIDNFEEQLIGKTTGEECEVNVTFPAEYHVEELKNKPAVFKVKVKEIQRKELPEANDDFASEVSDFDTMEEYKKDLTEKLQAEKIEAAKTADEDKVVAKVIENATMEIPDQMVEEQVNGMVNDYARRLESQGISFKQYVEITGMTAEKIGEQMKPQAIKRIQTRLVLEAVVKAENIQADDAAVEEQFDKMAEDFKMDKEQIKGMFGEEQMAQLKEDLAVQKAIDFLVAEAKFVD